MSVVIPFRRSAPSVPTTAMAEHIAALRKRVVTQIHLMIDLVDEIDGDPDFEPSLGWTKTMATGGFSDLEEAEQ